MGDRANVKILDQGAGIDDSPPLFIYTHHGGEELPEIIHRALARRASWDDGTYLARIVFCELVKGDPDELDGLTGLGIGTGLSDNEHPVVVLDAERQRIWLELADGTRLAEPPTLTEPEPSPEQTFRDFVNDPSMMFARYKKGLHA